MSPEPSIESRRRFTLDSLDGIRVLSPGDAQRERLREIAGTNPQPPADTEDEQADAT